MSCKSWLQLCGVVVLLTSAYTDRLTAQEAASQNSSTPAAARALGTVTSISGQSIVLKTDAGAELTVTVADTTKFLQLKPGQTNLKEATPLTLADLKTGDRVLVRGIAGSDGKSFQATSVIAMKQTDIADKQAHERAEWAQHSVGGLVKSIDAATGTIAVSTNAQGAQKEVSVHTTKQTVLRRYSANSIKFDDANPAPLSDIKAGDQLRARGQKNSDGTEIAADEIVSGTFRSIAGILVSADNASGMITVTDLATKQPVTLHVTSDSQLRKLQPFVAQAIAARLKGTPAGGAAGSNGATGASSAPKTAQAGAQGGNGAGMGPGGSGPGAGFGPGASGGQGRGDFQQMIARMPAATISDLTKGDALMIVATEGSGSSPSTVITLLGGVEPILQASSKATPDMILSPWSLGSGGGGEGATP
ncbi:MAG TPA: DUF5666 domain-containing protein [Candidatus Dormibacteraeota bacterium]|jgi:hypothetical protein|nr:DUF5666 domain-containing protein [Candidatus Dormibacteraeota bacterium]